MRLELVRRPQPSRAMALLSPLIAVALTVVTTAIVFTLYGVDPLRGLYIYFIAPLTEGWSREELVVKATPLILIARRPRGRLPLQQLEHRRGGPVHHRRDHRLDAADPFAGLPELRHAAADAGASARSAARSMR